MGKDLAFTPEEYRDRIERLRERMARRGIDVLLTHTPENICYLGGFHSAGYFKCQCCAVPLERDPFLVIRQFELRNAETYTWIDHIYIYTDTQSPVALTCEALTGAGLGAKAVGVEKDAWFLTVRDLEQLQASMPKARFVDGSGLVEAGRVVKSAAEVDYIRLAARPAEAAMAAAVEAARASATEDDVAGEAWRALVYGSEYPAYAPFVCSGPRSSMPHATRAGRRLGPGDALFLEIGGSVRRCGAALLRCGVIGGPDGRMVRMAEACVRAMEETLRAMKPGVLSCEVHALCQRALADAGWGGYHRHRTGYSIGVGFPPDWGEGHIKSLAADDREPLEAGMVFHVIPSLPMPEVAGIALGETVLVTEQGGESLTHFDRSLFVC